MNTSGMLRRYLARVMDNESYFYHVIHCVESQLDDWGHEAVLLFNWMDAVKEISMTFFIDGRLFLLQISKEQAARLQSQNAYQLDRCIWEQLMEQGFQLKNSSYIEKAFC
ncbi:hypothetical protein [Bacillus xiapuensis]|uniref:hypothetical protein n=1 Tax=Bacillus xiapuensis TaxID=2014075 RepID=UPI000C2319F0|nr:hypothetical protein [Bacillus xiapuensis]